MSIEAALVILVLAMAVPSMARADAQAGAQALRECEHPRQTIVDYSKAITSIGWQPLAVGTARHTEAASMVGEIVRAIEVLPYEFTSVEEVQDFLEKSYPYGLVKAKEQEAAMFSLGEMVLLVHLFGYGADRRIHCYLVGQHIPLVELFVKTPCRHKTKGDCAFSLWESQLTNPYGPSRLTFVRLFYQPGQYLLKGGQAIILSARFKRSDAEN